jgi:hypothetical protein
MRNLTKTEKTKLKLLTENQISVALIEPTQTGLKKSILDSTGSVRHYLKENKFHDYEIQGQGQEHKVIIETYIYTVSEKTKSRASLYRPNTKKGDPRIWFSKLGKVCNPNDLIAIIAYDKQLHIFNLTQIDIESVLTSKLINPLKELIEEINSQANTVAFELLSMLKTIAKSGPIPSMVDADTSVGRTLETALGIEINSSKQPDYKGIELKSFRSSRTNRKNLFTQVPDWKISKFKSSAEILDSFGYTRGNDFKLYCTVSTITRNSQGLKLRLDNDVKQLIENSDKKEIGDFVVWTLDKLHDRLQHKHKETFWVEADSLTINGKEHFQYKLVEHTKKPINSQFNILINDGIITLDHLIKRDTKGRVREKGPIFKIKPKGIDLLFPPSVKYELLD